MAVEHQQFDLFLSYSRKDEAFVNRLASALEQKQLSIWRDIDNLRATTRWLEEIQAAIEASSMFAIVLTQNYLDSDACKVELALALKSGKVIAPLLRGQGLKLPAEVAEVQWIAFYDDTRFDDAVRQLVDAVETDPAARNAHTRLLVRGTEWKESQLDDSLLRGAELASAEQWLAQWESDATTPDVLRVVRVQSDYVHASRAAAIQARHRRTMIASIIAVVIIVAALFAGWQTLNVRTRARQQHAAMLATEAMRTDDVELGLLMAADSLLEWPTVEADAFVRNHLRLVPSQLGAVSLATDATSAAFSADDSRIYLVPANQQLEGTAELWNGRDATRPFSQNVMRVIPAPDGPLLAVVRSDQRVDIIDGASGALVQTLQHARNVTSAAFSDNVKYVATGSWDRRVRIWELGIATPIAELERDGVINDVVFFGPTRVAFISAAPEFAVWSWRSRFPDAQPIVQPLDSTPVRLVRSRFAAMTATESGKLYFADGSRIRSSDDGIAKPTAFAVLQSSGSTRVAVGGNDGLVTVFGIVLRHPAPVKSIEFSPDGNRVLIAAGNAAYVWDESAQLVLKMAQPSIAFARFSHAGDRIVTAGTNGSVRMWSGTPRFAPRSISVDGRIASLRYLPNGQLAAIVQDPNVRFGAEESVFISEREGRWRRARLPPHEALAFAEDGSLAIAHVRDVTLLDERFRPRPNATIRFPFEVQELAFSKQDSLIAASGNDRNAAVHDLATHRTAVFPRLTATATSIAFAGSNGVALSELDRVSLYDNEGHHRGSAAHLFSAMRVVASRDRSLIAIAGGDSTTRIRTRRLRLHAELPHLALVHDLAFNKDGTRLATSADDGYVRIWDTAEARELVRLPRSGEQNAVAFSPDDRWIAFAKSDGQVEIWPWRPADLRDEVCRSVSRPIPRKTCEPRAARQTKASARR